MDAGSYLTSRPAGTVIFSMGSAKSGSSDEESPPAYQTTNGKKIYFTNSFFLFSSNSAIFHSLNPYVILIHSVAIISKECILNLLVRVESQPR
jgi:hypothetical protein